MLANIPFAQYVKADFDFAKNFMIDPRNSFVFHIGVGVAYPYGNSKMLPLKRGIFPVARTVYVGGLYVL